MTTRRDEVIEVMQDVLGSHQPKDWDDVDDLDELIVAFADAILERFCVISSHDYCAPHVSWWHADCETSCNKCMHCGRTREEDK